MYGVITFHRALNAGALLQCLALSRYMDSLGLDNVVIDYRNAFIERQHHPYKLYPDSLLKCAARAAVLGPVLAKRVKKFDGFVRDHMKTSKPYMSIEQLSADAGGYAAFVTGSDQVFSVDCAKFDKAYFLDFPGAEGKRYSYAASIGRDDLPEGYVQEYARRLSGYPFLSLREEAGAALIKNQLKLDVSAESHIDPVMLFDGDFWRGIATKPKEKDYIFLYTMLPSDTILQTAAALGKQTGLPVLWADDKYYKRHPGVSHRLAISPDEMLGYIAGARYVVTNSFHGTAFSILFEKQFIAEAAHAKSSRITALLSLLGLGSECVDSEPDWDAVRERLETERQRTAAYLRKIKHTVEGLPPEK
ncbi:MAG: polysaccharide pyruvyl transferase family protein [Oscillospiraceae bacterium]|nr:polysaccharide pyruvyl transferase family protein [Oscillospiraceae bacterium]